MKINDAERVAAYPESYSRNLRVSAVAFALETYENKRLSEKTRCRARAVFDRLWGYASGQP